jgi:hypothetical protein
VMFGKCPKRKTCASTFSLHPVSEELTTAPPATERAAGARERKWRRFIVGKATLIRVGPEVIENFNLRQVKHFRIHTAHPEFLHVM